MDWRKGEQYKERKEKAFHRNLLHKDTSHDTLNDVIEIEPRTVFSLKNSIFSLFCLRPRIYNMGKKCSGVGTDITAALPRDP